MPCGGIIGDFIGKTYKKLFAPVILREAKNITNFTISWIRSLDPVRRFITIQIIIIIIIIVRQTLFIHDIHTLKIKNCYTAWTRGWLGGGGGE